MQRILQHCAPPLFLSSGVLACVASMASAGCAPKVRPARTTAAESYVAFIANEASDIVSRVVFDPATSVLSSHEIAIGDRGRIAGAHGIAAAPDGTAWYVVLAHGANGGRVAKYAHPADTLVARVQIGAFPEDIAITPDGQYLYVANHDLHGAPDNISSVSIIFAPTMTEVARPNTCARPRGSALNQTASAHYSVCTGSDQVVEIDTRSFRVTHRYSLAPGREGLIDTERRGSRRVREQPCAPDAVTNGSAARNLLFIHCSATHEIEVMDVATWQPVRRFDVPSSASGIAANSDASLLLVALREDSTVLVVDASAGTTRARLHTTRSAPHGISLSDDGRFAFVTTEGSGAARGALDVFDMRTYRHVASTMLAYGPGSIDVITPRQGH
jgi:DNA-binding beta-propeller fold protein YncE